MGVSDVTNRQVYNGDGSSAVFAFSHYFFNQTDVNVWLYDTLLGGALLQTLNTNYTISGTPNAQGIYPLGANVVFASSPVNTTQVVIFRSPPEVQNFSLATNGLIPSTALVQQFDYLTLLTQRLEDQVGRSIVLSDGTAPTFSTILPSNISQNPNAAVIVNSGGNGLTFGVVLLVGTSAQTFFGTMPVANGGTGNAATPLAGQVVYAQTGTQYGYTAVGSSGLPLLSQGAGAPGFGLLNLNSATTGNVPISSGGTGNQAPPVQGQLVYASSATSYGYIVTTGSTGQALLSNGSSAPVFGQLNLTTGVTGVLPEVNGGTGASAFTGGLALFSGSSAITESTTTVTELGFVHNVTSAIQTQLNAKAPINSPTFTGSSAFPDGTLAAPSIAFTNDTLTGLHRGANQLTLGLRAVPLFDAIMINSSNISVGVGVASPNSSSTPLTWNSTINGSAIFVFANTSNGTSSQTVFQIGNGTGATYLTFENWASTTAGYLAGGAVVSAGVNETQFNICSEYTLGSIRFNVGGRTLLTERARLTSSSLTLSSNIPLIFTGSSANTVQVGAALTGSNYVLLLPATQGAANTVVTNDGSGNLSWASAAVGPLQTVSKNTAYNVAISDKIVLLSSSTFHVNLYTASGNAGNQVTFIKTDTTAGNIFIVGSSANIQGSSVILANQNETVSVFCDGTNWQISSMRKCPTSQKFTAAGSSVYTTPGNVTWIRVRTVAGGGGGAGSGTAAGTAAGAGQGSGFGGIQISTSGGAPGVFGANGGLGGNGTTSTFVFQMTGGAGAPGDAAQSSAGTTPLGGSGGGSVFGGAGGGGSINAAGTAGSANTGGGGGGGGGFTSVSAVNAGSGGGAGGYSEGIIQGPLASYTTSVGLGGTAGGAGAGGSAGGAGGTGFVLVEEYYD